MELFLTSDQKQVVWERSVDLFSDELSDLVLALFELEGAWDQERTFVTQDNDYLDEIELWIVRNVGILTWVAPSLHIRLMIDNEKQVFVIAVAGVDENDPIFITKMGGHVIWSQKGVDHLLNRDFISFLKSLVLCRLFVDQSILVGDSKCFIERRIPYHLIDSFKQSIECVDEGHSEVWMKLINRD